MVRIRRIRLSDKTSRLRTRKVIGTPLDLTTQSCVTPMYNSECYTDNHHCHHLGGQSLPVLRAFPLCTCCRYYPGTATAGCFFAHSHSHINLPRVCVRVGLCNVLFEDCSAFTHVTACTLDGSPEVNRYIKGFSYFVTSITAPIASGWSDDYRVGLSPTGKRRLITAHAHNGRSLISSERQKYDPKRTLVLENYLLPGI